MKRFLSILLCLFIVCSLVACDNAVTGDNQNNNNHNGNSYSSKLSNKHVNESQKMEMVLEDDETITPNGSLPNNEEDVKGLDVRYYFNEAVNAVIQLDEEMMKLYLCDEEYEALMEIKNNKDAYDLWQHTVGNLTYLPSASCWYGRSPHIVYAMWYEDQVKAGTTLKDEAGLMSFDELATIYNEYYDKAPIIVKYCGGADEYYIDDGYIKFEMGSPMLLMGVSELAEILDDDLYFPEDESETIHMNQLWELVLGWTAGDNEWENYDKIFEDGECQLLDAFKKKDLDAVIALIDADEKAWKDTWGNYQEDYETYMKNPAAKDALQKYMNDNVTFYRTHEEVYVLRKVDTSITYGEHHNSLRYASEAEQNLLNSTVYYNFDDVSGSEYLGTEWMNFMDEIIEGAEDHNILKDIVTD